MVIELPLRSDQERFDFVVTLNGVAYKFLFSWNSRQEGWFMSLSLEDDTPIWSGVRVVVNYPLGRVSNPLRPKGLLMAFDSAEQDEDPGLNDLGVRVRVLYFDTESVLSMRAQVT